MSKIFVDQVDPKTGTSLTLGTSGDTVNIPSGVTLANAGTVTGLPASAISSGTIATARLGSGTASSSTFLRGDQTYATAGMSNLAPFFSARQTANQSIPDSTYTKVQFPTEIADSGSVFDNSTNYRFTPGVTGKYIISAQVTMKDMSIDKKVQLAIYENGSNMNPGQAASMIQTPINENITVQFSLLLDVSSASDYYEVFIFQNKGSTQEIRGDFFNNFFGCKIG